MRRIDFLFLWNRAFMASVVYFFTLIIGLATTPGFSQELDKVSINYDAVFEDGLKRGGKLLNLAGKKIGDEGVKRLIVSGVLGKVEKLDLRYNEITSVGVGFLANMPPLYELRVLILRHNIIGDAGSMTLAGSDSFPNLEEIQLGWTETRDAGAKALGNTNKFKKLKKLDLRGNFLASKTKLELKKSLGNLKSLKLF